MASWSVYGRPIRTNNDIEGWHKRLNNMAHSQQSVNLYKLVDLLHTVTQRAPSIPDGSQWCRPASPTSHIYQDTGHHYEVMGPASRWGHHSQASAEDLFEGQWSCCKCLDGLSFYACP